MHTDAAVAEHYTNPDLQKSILDALVATGHDPDHLEPDDLVAVDQIHTGGVQAARDVAMAAGITHGMRVLDIGSGLGGPARLFAHHYGATVVGVDVTPEYVRTATVLTERAGLSKKVVFVEGSGTRLPFAEAGFDVATLLHVGMNIADKPALFAETARVLNPGGVLVVYDLMRTGEGDPDYPLPWAGTADISFLESPERYIAALRAAGFTVEGTRNRRDAGIQFIESGPRQGPGAPSPLGMHLILGPDGRVRTANVLAALKSGLLAPVEIVARTLP